MLRIFGADLRGATSIEYGMIVAVLGAGLLVAGPKIRDVVNAPLAQIASAGSSMQVESCSDATCRDRAARTTGAQAATGQSSDAR